jgi:hypothetical protein
MPSDAARATAARRGLKEARTLFRLRHCLKSPNPRLLTGRDLGLYRALLHLCGVGQRELSRLLAVFSNTARAIHSSRPLVCSVRWQGARPAHCPTVAPAQNFRASRSARNPPNFAVALNCGIGSSSLKADVNARSTGHAPAGPGVSGPRVMASMVIGSLTSSSVVSELMT